jgi:hypothetical protein
MECRRVGDMLGSSGCVPNFWPPKFWGVRPEEIWGPWLVSTGRNRKMGFRLLIHAQPSYRKWLVSAHLFMVLSETVN